MNWDRNIPSASRFTILSEFNNEAVRDNNTGLVWHRTPDATLRGWHDSRVLCTNSLVGGASGWRLPSVIELKSLQDRSLPPPFVPTDIFTATAGTYWSATAVAPPPTGQAVWVVTFAGGDAFPNGIGGGQTFLAWAVRGPMNSDTY
ncbi:MAG: DUF1566 domain-containing protein [Nitrospira sp.]|nr:DUF1566 domain-containing protein [Nitrospira sp.]